MNERDIERDAENLLKGKKNTFNNAQKPTKK
jgi:hypothetical protein